MSINLDKGGRINLSKNHPALSKIRVGLGWDCKKFDTGSNFDLDASVFILGANSKLLSDQHFVFYNNLQSPEGAVKHSGDNRSGDAQGDDEVINVDFAKIPPQATELSFVVTIHEADIRRQNFGQIENSYIRLYDDVTGDVIGQYQLGDEFSNETSLQFGSVYRNEAGEWLFKAVGAGYKRGLIDFVRAYGGNV
ncbi:TerD family protein [Parachitinimonas caeni]|uniref:TerD family protein n=1 Tax=Parachitinimonas caeni TaxID=3031301 RepID=A0ABT7E542_9NEIS|nr:TerD family protein [Parachitinimonas caeni]MDK2126042.1 TerD family protein [Parachitinimonas caeni]